MGRIIRWDRLARFPPERGVVEGGEIPYKPEALAQKKENFANRWKLDPEVKCYMPGIPRAAYMPFPFQIVQSASVILMAYEYASTNRVINMGKPQEAAVDTWMGTANGRWEGETLVVDNTGFNDLSWFDRAGDFHSDALHVVERYTRTGPDHITYEATIEDPQVFTQAVEDQHAALSPRREERAARRVQVCRVLRGTALRRFAQEEIRRSRPIDLKRLIMDNRVQQRCL